MTFKVGEFSFNLLDENGTVLQTKQNAADGTVTFDAIAYTEAMIGTHKYTIKEVVPADQANIQYDEGQVDVTVTVTKVVSIKRYPSSCFIRCEENLYQ